MLQPKKFAHRKQFVMSELVIANTDLTADLKAATDSARSLEEVAAWMDAHPARGLQRGSSPMGKLVTEIAGVDFLGETELAEIVQAGDALQGAAAL